MTVFLARAVVDFDASTQWDDGDALLAQLPAEMGRFRLDRSPNADLYFSNVYGIETDQLAHREVNWDYPISAIYLDTNVEAANRSQLVDCADRQSHNFELLLRLFQGGAVSVRRFSFPIGEGTGDGFSLWVLGNPVKSKVATSYERPLYLFNDAILSVFNEFFDLYWGTLDSLCPSVIGPCKNTGWTTYNSLMMTRCDDLRSLPIRRSSTEFVVHNAAQERPSGEPA